MTRSQPNTEGSAIARSRSKVPGGHLLAIYLLCNGLRATAAADGRLFLSVNPTLGKGPEPNGGPARPDVMQFNAAEPTAAPVSLAPIWQGKPAFTEHSY